MRIIFQDIDGPLIPLRLYFAGGRPFDHNVKSFIWDPVAVWMLNHLTNSCDAKIVFNTAHGVNPKEIMKHQAEKNGLGNLHEEDWLTIFPNNNNDRMGGITDWLKRHPEITDWTVIDDYDMKHQRQVLVDYNMGMTINDFSKAHYILTKKNWAQPIFVSVADKLV